MTNMSRWDSLRQDRRREPVRNGRGIASGAASSGLRARTGSRRSTEGDPRSDSVSHPSFPRKTQHSFSDSNPRELLQQLLSTDSQKGGPVFQETTKTKRLSILADYIASSRTPYAELGECDIVDDLVSKLFLSFLEDYTSSSLHQSSLQQYESSRSSGCFPGNTMDAILKVLSALQLLVGEKSAHKTGLMAPLVLEVSALGMEEQKPNQVRLRMFSSLQNLLRLTLARTDKNQELQRRVALCLRDTLRSARTVEGTSKHALGSQLDVDPSVLQDLFWQTQQQSNLRLVELSLELLIALVDRHPETSTKLTSFILVVEQYNTFSDKTTTNPSSIRLKSLVPTGSSDVQVDISYHYFFQVLCGHATEALNKGGNAFMTNRCSILAADLGVRLLDISWPIFGKWLKPRSRLTSGSFCDRIHSGFMTFMHVCESNLERRRNGSLPRDYHHLTVSHANLAGTLLRRVPFEDASLLASGMSLSASLVNVLVESFPSQNDHVTPAYLSALSQMADALLKPIGGYETPQGNTLLVSLPLKNYLSSDQGHDALTALLRSAMAKESYSLKVIRAILKTHPGPFLPTNSRNLWEPLLDIIGGDGRNTPTTLQMPLNRDFETLAAFLEGRMCILKHEENEESGKIIRLSSQQILEEILPLLQSNMKAETRTSVRLALLSCCGFLLSWDWDYIVRNGEGCLDDQFAMLLRDCQHIESSAKVKKVAFKALGDVCTNYFSSPAANQHILEEQNKVICESVCSALLSELEKESPSTSMALYTVGNLVRILQDVEFMVIEPLTLHDMGWRLLEYSDFRSKGKATCADPKIQTNSIRALGHVMCLQYSDKHPYQRERMDESRILLKSVLNVLNFYVEQSILLAQRKISGSWKERSAINKSGWGAGHALAAVLSAVIKQNNIPQQEDLLDEGCRNSIRGCLLTFFDCVSLLPSLHDKVGMVAMSALCAVDLSASRFTVTRTIPGTGQTDCLIPPLSPLILKCFDWIFDVQVRAHEEPVLQPRTIQQVETLLLHLLASCSLSECESLLTSLSKLNEDGGRRRLRILHDWLMKQEREQGTSHRPRIGVAVQRAFDTVSLTMHKRPDLVSAIDDIQLEQQFANQSSLLPMMKEAPGNKITKDTDDQDEL